MMSLLRELQLRQDSLLTELERKLKSPPRRRSRELQLRQRADGATLVCLAVLALLVTPARLVVRGLPLSLTPAELLCLGMAVFWLCTQFTSTLGAAKGPNPARRAIFAYGLACLAVYGYATYAYLPADELNLADHSLVLVIANVGFALTMCDGVRGRRRLDFALKSVVVAGTIVSLVGAFQFILDFDLTHYMEKFPLLHANSVAGVSSVIDRSAFRRVAATTGHPIEFGVISAMILPIAVHFGYHAKDRGQSPRWWWVCAVMVALGLMFAVSRSGVLAVACVGTVLFLGWPAKRRVRALGAVLVFLLAIRLLIPGLIGTFYSLFASIGSDDSIRYRIHDYPNATEEFLRHPWFGRGLGTWYAPKHQVFDNQYLLTMVEAGIVGIAAFVAA